MPETKSAQPTRTTRTIRTTGTTSTTSAISVIGVIDLPDAGRPIPGPRHSVAGVRVFHLDGTPYGRQPQA